MTKPASHYHSYLLRLWRSNPQSPWRSSVQSTASGEKHIFVDLAALFHFLNSQLAEEVATGQVDTTEKNIN